MASPPPPQLTNVDLYRLYCAADLCRRRRRKQEDQTEKRRKEKKERSLQDLYFSVRRFFVS